MRPIGLVNMGNTCYLNAVLSVLMQTDWLKRKMENSSDSPYIELTTDIDNYLKSESDSVSLKLPLVVEWVRRVLGNGPQCTLDLFTTIVNIPNPKTQTDDCELVSLHTQKIRCNECKNVSVSVEKTTIIVAVEKKMETILEYVCTPCKKKTTAEKIEEIEHPPVQNIVVFAIPRSGPHELHEYARRITINGFALIGFTICVGGHHIAAVNSCNKWYIVNDEVSKHVDSKSVTELLLRAHVLVFERTPK
jgi:hypothetical protein